MKFTDYDRKIAHMLRVDVGDEEVVIVPAAVATPVEECSEWGVGEWDNYAKQLEDDITGLETARDAAIGDRDRLLAQAVRDMRRHDSMRRGFFACAFLCSVLFVARVFGV